MDLHPAQELAVGRRQEGRPPQPARVVEALPAPQALAVLDPVEDVRQAGAFDQLPGHGRVQALVGEVFLRRHESVGLQSAEASETTVFCRGGLPKRSVLGVSTCW